ncbi:MAG: phosphate--AMP phosphotransferase [Eubacterium sp.]|nr:phosphate--AMP phosphotransferase [Eubacterium sp.]
MLKDYEKPKAEKKEKLKAEIKGLQAHFLLQQQKLMEAGLPVIVLVEGWSAAGKGHLLTELISEIDPRFYNVVSPAVTSEKESRYPFLYPYAKAIPENGKMLFMDSGWMDNVVRKYVRHEITDRQYAERVRSVNEFERQLRDGGYVIIKLFVHIDEQTQFERFAELREYAETEWRVTDEDIWQHKEYDRFLNAYDDFMEKTDKIVRWHVLNGEKHRMIVRDSLKRIVETIDEALEKGRYCGEPFKEKFPLLNMPKLAEVDLSPAIDDDEYKDELKELQKRLDLLHNVMYRKKIPVVLCYEGWDAAGKGGNIRRVTNALDPRGCDVHPIASPIPPELNRQYLWRFWTRLPKNGHICVFDRTWYGRVMVERIEGFCSEKDWKRAYNEINEFERQLTDWGAVVLKFWIHIDQETQLERFTARQNTPEKQWKITDEDWRNREKWPLYEEAVDEMLAKTSTENAPWYIIESNDKRYARIKALRIIVAALEKASEEQLGRGLGRAIR